MPRESTLRINVDVDKASAKARALANELRGIGRSGTDSGVQVQQGMNQAETAIQSAADKSAAAAVRFQTMTQGMINLSTAGVQTYTSISNLDRAMNRAHASTISFHRAQDLLERKQYSLNVEMGREIPNLEKIRLLRNEVATATEDLTVKEEKLKIEHSAVLDVQLLFAANLVNVGVSSLQVFTTMIGQETAAMIRSTLATKLKNVATWENFRASRTAGVGATGLAIGLGAESVAHGGATLATRLHTAALTGLKIALGPIGLIFIGISAAMAAYETNALGLKDTINGLLGIHDNLGDSLDSVTAEQNRLTDAMLNTDSTIKKMPDSFKALQEAVKKYRNELSIASAEQNAFIFNGQQQSNSIRLHTSIVNSTRGFSAGGTSRPKMGIFEWLSSIGSMPSAYASSTDTVSNFTNMGSFNGLSGMKGLGVGGTNDPTIDDSVEREASALLDSLNIFDYNFPNGLIPREIVDKAKFIVLYRDNLSNSEIQTKYAEIINAQIIAEGGVPKSMIQIAGLGRLVGTPGIDALLFNNSELKGLGFLENDKNRISFINKLIQLGRRDLVGRIGENILKNTIINGNIYTGQAKFGYAKTKLTRDLKMLRDDDIYALVGAKKGDILDEEQKIRFIALKTLGKSTIVTQDMKDFFDVNIGGVAGILSSEDSKRLITIETALRNYAKYGNIAAIQHNTQLGIESRQNIITTLINAGGGNARGYNTGRGGFRGISATAAFQVTGVNVPSWVRDEIDLNDAYANSGNAQALNTVRSLLGIGGGGSGGLSKSGSKRYMTNFNDAIKSIIPYVSNAVTFGISSDPEYAERLTMLFEDLEKRPSVQDIQGIIHGAGMIANEYNNKISGTLASIGIDVDFNNPVFSGRMLTGYEYQRKSFWKKIQYRETLSPMQQILKDIGASESISIPYGQKLVEITNAFSTNGNFTNFNNVAITKNAMIGLNLAEQSVFDIRFNATRGDRELLNRLRYTELLQSGSSGTSPI